MSARDYAMPKSRCRRCGKDVATVATGPVGAPSPGAVAICWYCGTIALFDDNLRFRAPTVEEVDELLAEPDVASFVYGLWDIQMRGQETADVLRWRCGCSAEARADVYTVTACAEECAVVRTLIKEIKAQGKPLVVVV